MLGSKFTDKSGYQGPSANSDNINGILGEGGDYKLKFKAWQNQLVNEIVKLINSGEFQDVYKEFGPKPLKKMPKSAAKQYVDGYPNYYSIIKSYNKGHSPEYGAKLLLNAWTKSKRSYTNYSKTTGKAMYLDYAKGGKVADVISKDAWNRLRSNGTDPLYNQYRDENGNFDSEKEFSVEVAERVHKEYQKFVNKYSGYMYEAPDGSTLKSDKTILDVIKENGDDDTTYYNIGWGNAIYKGYMGNADSGPTIYFLSKEDADKFVDVLKRTQSQMKEPLDNVYMYPLEKIVTNIDNIDPDSYDDFSDDRTEYPVDPELIQNDEKYDEEYEEDEEDDMIMYAEYLTYDGDFIKRVEFDEGVLLDDQDTINEIEGYDTGEVEYDTDKGVYYIEFSKSEPEDEEEDELEYDELDEEGKKKYLKEKEKGYVRKKGDIKLGRYFYPKYQFDGQEVRTVTHIEDAVGGRMVYFIDHLQGDGELGSYMEGFGIDTSYGPIMHESERKNVGSIEDPHYEYAKGGKIKDWENSMKERKDIEYLRIERTQALPNGKTMIYYKYNPIGSEQYRGTQVGTDSIYAKGGVLSSDEKKKIEEHISYIHQEDIDVEHLPTNKEYVEGIIEEKIVDKSKREAVEKYISDRDKSRKEYVDYWKEEDFAKGGEVKKKGQLSVSDTKKYWGYSDKEWEDLSDYEKNKAKTQAKVDKDNKYAEKMDNSSTKKGDNSMLIGGLAGVLLGIFIKK